MTSNGAPTHSTLINQQVAQQTAVYEKGYKLIVSVSLFRPSRWNNLSAEPRSEHPSILDGELLTQILNS